MIGQIKRKPGRPPGSINKAKVLPSGNMIVNVAMENRFLMLLLVD